MLLIKNTTVHKDLTKHAKIHWKDLATIKNGGFISAGVRHDARLAAR